MDSILSFLGAISWWMWLILVVLLVAIYDTFIQKKHIILKNFPVVGHFRYMLRKYRSRATPVYCGK